MTSFAAWCDDTPVLLIGFAVSVTLAAEGVFGAWMRRRQKER